MCLAQNTFPVRLPQGITAANGAIANFIPVRYTVTEKVATPGLDNRD